ncbi:hypothetical protein, partial [Actinacidiphila glaucinigra]
MVITAVDALAHPLPGTRAEPALIIRQLRRMALAPRGGGARGQDGAAGADGQAERLRGAGADAYNHNLNTSEATYGDITT